MNRTSLFLAFGAALLSGGFKTHAAVISSPVSTSDAAKIPPPRENPAVTRILKAMDNASWGHPDLLGQFNGLKHLFAGDYAGALRLFKIGARNADKFSQNSIGMMYWKDRGVRKDPVTACAWLALAAERKSPKFVNAHDALCATLTPAQHDQAAAVLAKLLPEYGDKVAKPRMALAND